MSLPQFKVEFGFGSGLSDAAPTWTDVVTTTKPVWNVTTKRGRSYELDTPQPGTSTVTLDNRDGRYTPPGAGGTTYAGQVLLMTPERISVLLSSAGLSAYPGLVFPGSFYPSEDPGLLAVPIFTGNVQRWPQQWGAAGGLGSSPVQASDLLSMLAQIQLGPVTTQEYLADAPVLLYPLDDSNVAAAITDLGSLNRPGQLTYRGSAGGTYNSAATSILADASTSCLSLKQISAPFLLGGYVVECANPTTGPALCGDPSVSAGTPRDLTAWTVEAAFQTATYTVDNQAGGTILSALLPTSLGVPAALFNGFRLYAIPSDAPGGGRVECDLDDYDTGQFLDITRATGIQGGVTHHLAATFTGTVLTLYLDGTAIGTASRLTSDPKVAVRMTNLTVGGDPALNQNPFNGSVCMIGVYGTALSAGRIAQHAAAALAGCAGETSGARVARLVSYQPNPVATSIGAGSSTMGIAKTAGKSLLQALQDVQTSENGELFVAGDGSLIFTARTSRYDQTDAFTFGDGAGELPYSDLQIDYDPTYVFNDVQVTRDGGATVKVPDSAGSQARYGRRSTQVTTYVDTDDEAFDAASYLYGRYHEPHLRISSVTLDLAANPALIVPVLSLDIGVQVGVNRRPPGAPTILGDYVIESIGHTVDMQAGRWTVTFELSPADVSNYWVLEDPTFGFIDDDVVLAY